MDHKKQSKLMVLMQSSLSNEDPERTRDIGSEVADDDEPYRPDITARSAPNSPDISAPSAFCTTANFSSSIVYLSQELQNLGFRYKLIELHGEKLNLVALVNSCWDVIQLYHSAIKDGNILHDSRRRDVADISHLQGSVRELKCVIDEKERSLQEYVEKERQTSSINKALASKLKSEKDEVRRLNSVLQQREAQHQHENRKKELEVNKLQDRLHRMVSGDRGSDSRMSSLTMTGSLNRSDRARGRWRTDNATVKHEEELYRRVLGQYESWVGQLTEETDLLKEFLGSVTSRLSKMAAQCASMQVTALADDKDSLNDSASVLSYESFDEEPIFSLSFLAVRDSIRKTIDQYLALIAQGLESKDNKKIKNDKIKTDIENNSVPQSPSNEQPTPTYGQLDESLGRTLAMLAEGACVEKDFELQKEALQVRKIRKELQKEREKYAAAVVKLNKERAAFEAEKVELLRNQFLAELPDSLNCSMSKDPFTPNTSMESLNDLYGDSPRNLTANPTLTSPTGNVTRTSQPVSLGPTRIPSHRRGSKLDTPRGVSGKSEPSTRNPSLSRHAEMRFLHDMPRAETLDRPRAAARSGVVSPSTRPSSRLSRGHGDPTMSKTINYPPVESRGQMDYPRTPMRHSGEFPFISGASSPRSFHQGAQHPVDGSEDSGFYLDEYESEYLSSTLRNAHTNKRLNSLENTLTSLMHQISSGEATLTRKRGACSPTDGENTPPSREGFLTQQPSFEDPCAPLLRERDLSATDPCPRSSLLSPLGSRASRLNMGSAPGSLGPSRKSSSERTGEHYLKKIQNNIAKWHWK